MALATIDDIKRLLKRHDEEGDPFEDDLRKALAAAEAWWANATGTNYDASGTITETFYSVRDDETLWLKNRSPSAVVVTLFYASDSNGEVLTVNRGYAIETDRWGDTRIRLSRITTAGVVGISGVRVRTLARTAARVEVAYTPNASAVPADVRDAVAAIAAFKYTRSTTDASNLKSERLGSYSYTVNSEDEQSEDFPSSAQSAVQQHRRYAIRST